MNIVTIGVVAVVAFLVYKGIRGVKKLFGVAIAIALAYYLCMHFGII